MIYPFGAVSLVLEALFRTGARQATKYVNDKFIIRATRPIYGKKGQKRIAKGDNLLVLLAIGKPNYAEREYIKTLKKAGEPFPVKKIILKFPPKSKKK